MTFHSTVCPHDCPSCCALEVDVTDNRISTVRGAAANDYTAGVICAKVARYAEREHHPDRLTVPLLRTGAKGSGSFRPIGWDEALDRIVGQFTTLTERHGAETVWPYYFAGTMGHVQRDGINRLRHVMRYSRQKMTICTTIMESGWRAGVGPRHRAGPARDGGKRPDRHVGRQSRRHPGQRHDAHHPSPEAARGEAGRGGPVPHRHGRRRGHPFGTAPRHRRCAGMRRHALRVPRWACGPGVYGALRRRAGQNWRRICAPARQAWAAEITGLDVAEIEGVRPRLQRHPASLSTGRLRVQPGPQRRGDAACSDLPAHRHRQMAACRRRGVLEQPRHLWLGQDR